MGVSKQYGDYVLYDVGRYRWAKRLAKQQIASHKYISEEDRKSIIFWRQLHDLYTDEEGKSWILRPSAAKRRGLYLLCWKTIPKKDLIIPPSPPCHSVSSSVPR
jgi:hypothetical protein